MESTPPPPTSVCYRHTTREAHIKCQHCGNTICPDCMTGAAVGFHCPDCVKRGRKETRSGLATYGGQRSHNPQLTTYVLIGINAAVWLAITVRNNLVDTLALLPQGLCSVAGGGGYFPGATEADCQLSGQAEWVEGVATGAPWQLLTSVFAHEQVFHILMNMVVLGLLGPQLEQVLGRARFLAVYLIAGFAGSAAVMWLAGAQNFTLGASGAIFGLLGALVVVTFKMRGNYQSVLTWVGAYLVLGFVIPGVSWQGHLGGLIGGALATAAIAYAPKQRRSLVQWSALGVLLIVVLLVSGVRAAVLA